MKIVNINDIVESTRTGAIGRVEYVSPTGGLVYFRDDWEAPLQIELTKYVLVLECAE